MLATKNRLTEKNDFMRVKNLGRLTHGESFNLGFYNRKDKADSRFAFIISKQVSPNASKRNYIKRALAESLRQNMYNIKDGIDGVFIVKAKAAEKYMTELMPEVVDILKKSKLLKS